jgi:hypothetical protein
MNLETNQLTLTDFGKVPKAGAPFGVELTFDFCTKIRKLTLESESRLF